jgi:hypothetical protein
MKPGFPIGSMIDGIPRGSQPFFNERSYFHIIFN